MEREFREREYLYSLESQPMLFKVALWFSSTFDSWWVTCSILLTPKLSEDIRESLPISFQMSSTSALGHQLLFLIFCLIIDTSHFSKLRHRKKNSKNFWKIHFSRTAYNMLHIRILFCSAYSLYFKWLIKWQSG